MDRDICVIFNPAAGRGRAARRLLRLQHKLAGRSDWRPTARSGHGIELARQAAEEGFAIVAAAGGDGTVHEVANGILQAGRSDVTFGILPVGSANDYVASLEFEQRDGTLPRGELPHLRSQETETGLSAPSSAKTVDVGLVRGPDGRQKYFVCCLGLGLNGAVTMEARKIRRLQGLFLYGLATLNAIWRHYRCPRMTLSLDGGPEETTPTLMLSLLVGRREGGFVLAPHARMDDGRFDYVHTGDLSRWQILRFLPRLALLGPPENHPKVRLGQCNTLRLKSESPLAVHLDGEFFCVPEEKITQLEVEIVPRALRVLTLAKPEM